MSELTKVDPRSIIWPDWAKREFVDGDFIEELGRDMRHRGQQVPIVVRRAPDGGLVGVSGYQRCIAAIRHGLKEVEAKVVELGDWEAYVTHAKENVLRRDLSVFDLARKVAYGIKDLGRPEPVVRDIWSLKKGEAAVLVEIDRLPQEVKRAVGASRVDISKLYELRRVRDVKVAAELARWIVSAEPTVQAIRERIEEIRENELFDEKGQIRGRDVSATKTAVSPEEAKIGEIGKAGGIVESKTTEEATREFVSPEPERGPSLDEPRICVFDGRTYPMGEMRHIWMHRKYWKPFTEHLEDIKRLVRAPPSNSGEPVGCQNPREERGHGLPLSATPRSSEGD
jgi:ParB/RepB/Spo0J family partition protein